MLKDKYLENKEISKPNYDKEVINVSYQEYGKKCSITQSGKKESFLLHLNTLLSGHIITQADLERAEKESIKPLEDDINKLNNQIKDLENKQENIIPTQIERLENEIHDLEEELVKLESTDPLEHQRRTTGVEFNKKKHNTIKFFLLSLTITIFYFYANVAWVIYSLPEIMTDEMAYSGCSPGVFNSLNDLLGSKPCFSSAGIPSILLPVLFLVFAYLIHLIATETRKYKWLFVSSVVLIVLIIDIVLAVQFEMRLETMNGAFDIYNQGPTTFLEKLKYVASTDNFLIILALGFFSYIFWSALLHFYGEEEKLKRPIIILNRSINQKQKQIDDKKKSCLEKKDEIDIHIPSEIESKKRSILEKRKLLKIEIVGGYDKLKKRISEFTLGWLSFITFEYSSNPEKRDDLIDDITITKDNFIKEFIPK